MHVLDRLTFTIAMVYNPQKMKVSTISFLMMVADITLKMMLQKKQNRVI